MEKSYLADVASGDTFLYLLLGPRSWERVKENLILPVIEISGKFIKTKSS